MSPALFLEHYQWFLRVTLEEPQEKFRAEAVLRAQFARDFALVIQALHKERP